MKRDIGFRPAGEMEGSCTGPEKIEEQNCATTNHNLGRLAKAEGVSDTKYIPQ
jgi:hypothetical protein